MSSSTRTPSGSAKAGPFKKRGNKGGFRKGGSRRSVTVSTDALVRTPGLAAGETFPLVVEPAVEGFDPMTWARDHGAWIDQHLDRYGALLLRGFGFQNPVAFETFCAAAGAESLEYTERSSPRSRVEGKIFTSTDYPPEREIFLHNEQSYNTVFPRRIAFCCLQESNTGGATPIADTRRFFAEMDPEIRRRFVERDYLYVRNLGGGLGLSWQEAFQTEDPAAVEAYCEANDIRATWLEGEGGTRRLRTAQRRSAAARHPVTGDGTWFNHITFFHVTTLEADVRDSFLSALAAEDLPNQTYYGDGEEIEAETLEHLRALYRRLTVRFPWKQGDALLLDNMLAAHGRDPFEGARKVVVSMSAPTPWSEVALDSDGLDQLSSGAAGRERTQA
ncbi:MAG: TauD/TfdA family dioxygenase [Acidobacteriota bacterium]